MTDTEVCNLALGRLGETAITSLTETSAAARACNLFYAQTRRAVLRSHRWNFATRRLTLTELAETPAFGWAHQYQLPDDCEYPVAVNESDEGDLVSTPYAVEGRKILCDDDSCDLVYIIDEDNPDEWDSLFVDVVSVTLAVKVSNFLRGSSSATAELLAELTTLTAPLAKTTDANESRGSRGPRGTVALNSDWIRARGCGS